MTGLVVAGMAAYATYQAFRSNGGDGPDPASSVLIYGFFGLVTALGIGLAWWRVLQDRRRRRNRSKPLDLG